MMSHSATLVAYYATCAPLPEVLLKQGSAVRSAFRAKLKTEPAFANDLSACFG